MTHPIKGLRAVPDLGRLDPAVVLARGSLDTAQRSFLSGQQRPASAVTPCEESDEDALLASSQSLARAQDAYTSARGRATARLSARAIAAGYAAGIAVLLALLPVVRVLGAGSTNAGGTWPLRVAVASSGAWWLIGSVPAVAWLRPTERGGSRRRQSGAKSGAWASLVASVRSGWSGLADMLREWRSVPQTFRFLLSWFLLSDGASPHALARSLLRLTPLTSLDESAAFATITSTAVLFAKTSLGLPTSSLIVIAILTPLSGLFGALVCPFLQSHAALASLRLTTHRMLVLLVLASLVVPLWGLVALRTAPQMYALSIVFGSLFGAYQSFARALYASLIPPRAASRWFALYSITDKSSSFVGPLLVAVVTTATGEIRHGFVLIAGLMALAVPVLVGVDVAKGAEDAEKVDGELKSEGEGLADADEDEEARNGRA